MPVVAPAGEALFPTAEKVPKKAALNTVCPNGFPCIVYAKHLLP